MALTAYRPACCSASSSCLSITYYLWYYVL